MSHDAEVVAFTAGEVWPRYEITNPKPKEYYVWRQRKLGDVPMKVQTAAFTDFASARQFMRNTSLADKHEREFKPKKWSFTASQAAQNGFTTTPTEI